MIPKTIHYCWFGRNPKPKLAKKCIKSWKRRCPDYEIIEWNEDNFDISACPIYVRQAYEAKKWAFVTDYVRLKVVYDHGGIYLDTDVELRKNLDFLLANHAYFGFEDGNYIATGLGFGAEKGAPILAELMADYADIPFIHPDGSIDHTPCPRRNTEIFLWHGLEQDDQKQILDDSILILPTEYLSPLDYETGKKRMTRHTVSIHWFAASWQPKEQRDKHRKAKREFRKADTWHNLVHTPNRILLGLLGKERYEAVKKRLKGL